MNDTNPPQGYAPLENRSLIYLGLFLILLLSIISLISLYASRGIRIYEPEKRVVEKPDLFRDVAIEAKSAIVYDIKNKKVLFEKDALTSRPLASITKILTAVTAIESLNKGAIVSINKEFLKEEGDTGLRRDEKWELEDLLDYSLVVSSNDGALAIAAAATGFDGTQDIQTTRAEFVKKMNKKAHAIGMTNSLFLNETGLDIDSEKNGGYASARDVVSLFEYTLRNHPKIFEATKQAEIYVTSLNKITHNGTNTNPSVNIVPGMIASKTGFTDIAGGNLAIIFDPSLGRPISVVVLGSTSEGRFEDVQILVEKTLETIGQE